MSDRAQDAPPRDAAARELTAEVMGIRWSVPDGDFAVLDAVCEDGETAVLVGALGHVREGESIAIGGDWRCHPRHGWQFAVDRVRILEPVSDGAVSAYLESVKHIGPRGAALLIARYGAGEVLAAIDRDPEGALGGVPGIGARRIGGAVRSWRDQRGLRELRLFLDTHGVDAASAGRIARHFGAGSIARLQREPYAICELDGIGFATADALARALDTPLDAPDRLAAGVMHALDQAQTDGHCHLPRAELAQRAAKLLAGAVDVDEAIDRLAARGRVVVDDRARVADARLHAVEQRLAGHVRRLLHDEPAFELENVERPTSGSFVPSDGQWRGVTQALEHRLSILTGGPGTGKSATMRTLVDLLTANRRSARLCAPTGKAARRLGELTGVEATTIHRLLEWAPDEGFTRDADQPIEGCDMLIVDEASMLSVHLAEALLAAVGPKTHVLLVGDVDQLAPIGPGRVLEDLLAVHPPASVPATRLTQVFRQAARSLIVRAAHAINAGELPDGVAGEDDVRDFFLILRDGPAAIFSEVCELAATRLPAHYDLDPAADVQVLAPMHKGPLGIDALNAELRLRLNPDGTPIAGSGLRVGDKVMQTRNSYEHDLFNGERGVLVHHDPERDRVLFAGEDGRRVSLPVDALDTLRLAYAATVHKAQGSQARAIVVPVFRGHQIMLTRNLVYTAVTRAQDVCVVVAERSALATAVGRTDARLRHTRLRELVALG
ncbi:MAG TPA: ATP-dependent RecD-like DNA helicase [Solirubrobacteraceae bacterium]|jgi:exodeoxyribonuclease V alpha subunit|nr:ATP-dependent RecD-like DNA helicase [Solirubrobacteraceae bacterium]